MSKVLFAQTFLDPRFHLFEARVGFDRADELRDFLERNNAPNLAGCHVAIGYRPRTGYDGKPVYQADVTISKPLPVEESLPFLVRDSGPDQDYAGGAAKTCPDRTTRVGLSWEERERFRKETTGVLRQLGMTDLGQWK